jgi:hypothetical protein
VVESAGEEARSDDPAMIMSHWTAAEALSHARRRFSGPRLCAEHQLMEFGHFPSICRIAHCSLHIAHFEKALPALAANLCRPSCDQSQFNAQ